jgi:hypothetical protein
MNQAAITTSVPGRRTQADTKSIAMSTLPWPKKENHETIVLA